MHIAESRGTELKVLCVFSAKPFCFATFWHICIMKSCAAVVVGVNITAKMIFAYLSNVLYSGTPLVDNRCISDTPTSQKSSHS